jgi:hypothetical protein
MVQHLSLNPDGTQPQQKKIAPFLCSSLPIVKMSRAGGTDDSDSENQLLSQPDAKE